MSLLPLLLTLFLTSAGAEGPVVPVAADSTPVTNIPIIDEDTIPDEFGPESTEPLPNFRVVTEGKVLRSAQPSAEGLASLAADGLKTTLILRNRVAQEEKEAAAALGLRVQHVPMNGVLSPTFKQVDRALSILMDPSQQPVLFHCRRGMDRTGVVGAAYRVVAEGWTIPKAVHEAQTAGCCIPTFKDLDTYLEGYVKHRSKKGVAAR